MATITTKDGAKIFYKDSDSRRVFSTPQRPLMQATSGFSHNL